MITNYEKGIILSAPLSEQTTRRCPHPDAGQTVPAMQAWTLGAVSLVVKTKGFDVRKVGVEFQLLSC